MKVAPTGHCKNKLAGNNNSRNANTDRVAEKREMGSEADNHNKINLKTAAHAVW